MSEFIAEAQVLVTPNTSTFRSELLAQLAAVQRSIPGIVIPISGFDQASLRTAAAGVAGAANEASVAVNGETTALTRLTKSSLEAAGAQRTLAASQTASTAAARNAERGIFTQVASFAGLRGAVLGANSAFILGAAGAITFFKSLEQAAQVETNLNTFRVTAGATAEELTKVGEAARQLGRDISLPGVSAADAVQAMLELAKAGLSVQQSMAAARGTLQLATAAETDNATAAQLVANALNAFGLAGEKAVSVADLLANAANASQGSIEDMGIALRQVAATAEQVGLSAKDTVVLLTQLAKAGIAGSDAGTTLRVALSRLIAPTKAAQEEINKLGIKLRDAQGNLRPDIFVQVGAAMQTLDRASQDNAFVTIFGQNAQRVASILSRQGEPALRATQDALSREGTAADVASAKTEGLAGSAENAKNQFAAFSLEIGQLASPLASLGLDSVALLFGTLADELHAIREEWGNQISDLKKVGDAFKDLSDNSGFTDFVHDVNEGGKLLQGDLENAAHATKDFLFFVTGVGTSSDKVAPKIRTVTKVVQEYIPAIRDAGDATAAFARRLEELTNSAGKAATSQQKLTLSIETARAGGNDSALVDALRERESNLEAFIKRLEGRKQTRAVVDTLIKANQDLENVRSEIQSILDQQAAETKAAATQAQKTRDERDQAFLDLLGAGRQRAENRTIAAQGTQTLKDDIASQSALLTLLTQQLERIRKTVKDAKTRAAAIAAVTTQMIQVGNEIKNLRDQQDAAIKEAAANARSRAEQSIQLDIDLAVTTQNRTAEIKARQRLVALLKKELREVKKGTNAWKEIRNAIAEQEAAIKDAQKQGKETGKTLASSQFEFLQSQQGFAANLLGNLIPGFATAGLVGGSTPAPDTVTALKTQAQVSQASTGTVRPVQVDTTNALLRQILAALNGRHTQPPEARYQRHEQRAAFDGVHGG